MVCDLRRTSDLTAVWDMLQKKSSSPVYTKKSLTDNQVLNSFVIWQDNKYFYIPKYT